MSDENPYAAPDEEGRFADSDEMEIAGLPIASQNRRFVNFFVDNIMIRVFAGLGGLAVGFAAAASGGGVVDEADMAGIQLIGALVGILICIAYFVILEGALGITIGKLLTGTKVIGADGSAPTFGQILGRSVARLIPFEPFSFLFGDKTTGWHDSLSGTRVVRRR